MEKKIWVKPEMNEVVFAPNEYVANNCGDQNIIYKFICDAGKSWKEYNVFFNGDDGVAETDDDIAWTADDRYDPIHSDGYYHPCGTTHEASSDSGFEKGYMYEQGNRGQNRGDRIDVIVWTDNGTNTHCTTNLNMDSWETAKS